MTSAEPSGAAGLAAVLVVEDADPTAAEAAALIAAMSRDIADRYGDEEPEAG